MTRHRSTFLAGQPADPDELQVEFERRNAPLPDRLIGEFHPDQRNRVRMRLVSFCQSWVEDCRRQTQNKPTPMSTLYQKVRENQRKQRQLAKRAKHRKGKAAARATVHLSRP